MTTKPRADIAEPPTQEATQEAEQSAPGAPPSSSAQPDASRLELFLPEQAPRALSGLRSARLMSTSARRAVVHVRGESAPREVALDPDVDDVVVREALETGDRVMVESDEDGEPVLVGVLRCRQPETLRLNAAVIEIDADREILLRSGKGALRIREDGDVELVGSRISAASRGLFRLVGKMLRLN